MACLFIGQLPFSKFFNADVYDLLEPYGKVISVRMQHVKGEAFVCFDTVSGADAAIAALHGRRTLKGRQRPLQLFYASSSAQWSWFGILHNTRLHHLNPKVELPPFFSRTPPLSDAQWSLVPRVTADATELVLPATLLALQATAAHTERGSNSDDQNSCSSSLRTTTSSSSLYSIDSSGNSVGSSGRPSRPPHGTTIAANSCTSVSSMRCGGTPAPLAGSKRARQQHQQPHSICGNEKEEVKSAVGTTVVLKAAKRSPVRTAHQSGEAVETEREGAHISREPRTRRRTTHSHRKTKLHIEDEENFAVLDEEKEDDNGEEDTTLVMVHLSFSLEHLHESREALCSAKAERHRLTSLSVPTTTATTTAAVPSLSSVDAPATGLSSVLEPNSTTASPNLSATHSSLEDADVVGTKNVVIRRRRSKAVSSAFSANLSLTSPIGPAVVTTTTSAPAPAAAAAAAAFTRQPYGSVIPRNFHHRTAHSPVSSMPPLLSITLGDSTTSTVCASHELSQTASVTSAAAAVPADTTVSAAMGVAVPPSSPLVAQQQRQMWISTPHHHHHHHLRRGAVLPDNTLRHVVRREDGTTTGDRGGAGGGNRGVLGPAEVVAMGASHQGISSLCGASIMGGMHNNNSRQWMELNEPVFGSLTTAVSSVAVAAARPPQHASSPDQKAIFAPLIPSEASQADGAVRGSESLQRGRGFSGAKNSFNAGRGRVERGYRQ
jgi:hypothetical protein